MCIAWIIPVNAVDFNGELPVFLISLVKGTIGDSRYCCLSYISMANRQEFGEAMPSLFSHKEIQDSCIALLKCSNDTVKQ